MSTEQWIEIITQSVINVLAALGIGGGGYAAYRMTTKKWRNGEANKRDHSRSLLEEIREHTSEIPGMKTQIEKLEASFTAHVQADAEQFQSFERAIGRLEGANK